MAKFVPDIKTQRWIVISPARWGRPEDKGEKKAPSTCPFCYGGESLTPPEIVRMGDGEKDTPGWIIRVVPNKFPITDIHEVIIHSPEHEKDIVQFEPSQVISLITTYRERYNTHQDDGHVMIFSNHGEHAGASLVHPHSQVVVIPHQINLDALVREPVLNVIEDDAHFVIYCPDFSQWPYEVWIAPQKEHTVFGEITDEEVKNLSVLLHRTLKRLYIKYEDPQIKKIRKDGASFAYNFYIHHAKNWFIRIIPRLVHRAGFELGTGLSVNIVDPTIAAAELKDITIS